MIETDFESELSRRVFLIGGIGGIAALACGGESKVCGLAAEQTVGPYYVDKRILRKDITEGKPGVPLRLRVAIVDSKRCAPIPNAAVDIWHCDAGGVYSGYTANSPDGPLGMPPSHRGGRPPGPLPGDFGPGPGGMPPPDFSRGPSDEITFLRGVQLTDKSGVAEFLTIYPGWYVSRDIHIHLKVHTGGHVCHTGQLFFPNDLSDQIARIEPYARHHAARTRQEEDDIFTSQHGSDFILDLTRIDKKSLADGLVGVAVLGVDPDATPRPAGPGGPDF